MAGARRGGRELDKSDPIDALAVARAALGEPGLPVARLEGASREVKLLLDHREDLVAEQTRMQNRLRWHLHELEPGYEIPLRGLDRKVVLGALAEQLGKHQGVVAEIASELVVEIASKTERINQLERRVASLMAELAPSLVALEVAGADRGQDRGRDRRREPLQLPGRLCHEQRHRAHPRLVGQPNPLPPQPWWQPPTQRCSSSDRSHQIRLAGPGRAYLERRVAAANSKTEAIRALRRRISDDVYRRLWQDHLVASASSAALPA